MAVTAHSFPQFDQKIATKTVNASTDTLKLMLLTAYTYADSHATIADVLGAGTEVGTGNGYTAGGLTVSGVSLSTSAKVTTLTATNPTITVPLSGSLAFAYAVWFFDVGGTNATRYPAAYWDLGGTSTFNDTGGGAETVTVTIDAAGICHWTAS